MEISISFLVLICVFSLTDAMQTTVGPVITSAPPFPPPIFTFTGEAHIFVKIEGATQVEGGKIKQRSGEAAPLPWLNEPLNQETPHVPEHVFIHLHELDQFPMRHLDYDAELEIVPYHSSSDKIKINKEPSECFVIDGANIYHTILHANRPETGISSDRAMISVRAPNPQNNNMDTCFWGSLEHWDPYEEHLPKWFWRRIPADVTFPLRKAYIANKKPRV